MAKFMESASDIKRSVKKPKGKKKDEETVKKAQSPSVSNKAQQTVNRLNQKYAGGSTRQQTVKKPASNRNNSQNVSQQTQRTVDRLNAKYGQNRVERDKEERRFQPNNTSTQRMSRNPRMLDTSSNINPDRDPQDAANRAVRNTPKVVKESLKQVAAGHGKTAADITSLNESANIGSKIDIKSKEFQEDIEKRRKKSTETAKKAYNEISNIQDKSEQNMQKLTKDAKGLEKAYYGALESGTGMVTDQLLGPAWAVSMMSRTYGNNRGKAQQEGATENEDRANALLQGAKEVATEYLFRGVGLASNLSGRVSLSPSEKLAKAATRNMTGTAANVTHAGIRLLGGTAEENAEELIGWGLDPLISEVAYKRNVRSREAKQMLKAQSDDLRSNITSEEDARAIAAYLGSDDFIKSNMKTYMDSGIGEAEARELAEKMRDYLNASLTGDAESMADIEDELSKTLSGKGLSKENWSLSELMDTVASTTLLTMTTGLPGSMSTAARGAAFLDNNSNERIRALADTAVDFENKEMSAKAEAMRDRIDSGKELTSTQAYDLMQGVAEQYQKDSDRQQAAFRVAENTINNEQMVAPFEMSRTGNIRMGEVTNKEYRSSAREAKKSIETLVESDESMSLTDEAIDRGSRAIAGFKTGVFTVDDANELNYRNTAVRDAFKAETGIDLNEYIVKGENGEVDIPATNTATKNALFAQAAENLVVSAQAETANWMDNTKGKVVTQISKRMGAQGSVELQYVLDDVDERDRATYMMTANVADMMYQQGRNLGVAWDDVKADAKRLAPEISEDKLREMYEAGRFDRDRASDEARGQQVKIGEKVALAKDNKAPMGQVLIDTDKAVKGTVIRAFSEIAKNLGVDIHLVDHFVDKNGKVLRNVNGEYINGAIYINVNSKFEKNIGYIFMHEVTHHLKTFAPEQYQELENLVRDRWFKYDAAQMQNEIAKKIAAYERNGQRLTEEQALEEIIADAAHEFLNDRNFANAVAEENPSLAQAVLNSIRNALRMLRRVLATGSIEDDTHMNTLFSQLDILDEAERLWLGAYTQAVKNKAAVEVNRLQNQIYEEGRLSVGYHAGDLGKSRNDDYWGQGYGRGTGHFGFGTYFVGNQDRIKNYNNRNGEQSPVEEVDFDKYNLFRPSNFDKGLALHDALKVVDGFITDYSELANLDILNEKDAATINLMHHGIQSSLENYLWDEENLKAKKAVDDFIDAMPERYKDDLDSKARQAYNDAQQRSVEEADVRRYLSQMYDLVHRYSDETEEEYVERRLAKEIESRNEEKKTPVEEWKYRYAEDVIKEYTDAWDFKRNKLSNLGWDLTTALNYQHSSGQIKKALLETERIVKNYPSKDVRGLDSPATVFMKQLGYEGVDVRHINELDNVQFGSVIYDLKGDDLSRKQEIGTAKFSLSEPKEDNEGAALTEDQQRFYANVAPELRDENGNIKRYFHGTARADRVGYYFNPERATSGPMAYFTDNRDIATNYSRDKADTSLAYEGEDVNDYHNQFVVDVDGEEVRLEDYWYHLPASKRNEYRDRAGHITYDYDGDDDTALIIDKNVSNGNGGYGADPYLVRQARGNVFRMLIDAWLDSGDFFNEEERFLEVMDLLGMKGVRYKDPNYREEKVYEVYLNVTNPLVTTELDEEFAADVEDWLDATDLDYYARESASADMWDKNDRDPYDWLDALRDDIENGTTHVWTSIPDVITDFLKEQGYDGIVDQGGKYHEAGHQVVIPFEPNQIKLTTNEHPTEDVDIRYSIDDDSRVMYTPKGIEVVQNPTDSEYSSMREEILAEYPWLRGTGEPLLRHTYDESGNEYYWSAFDGMHRDVEPYINRQYNTRTSQQWKWYEKPDKDDYPTDYSAMMVRYSIAADLDEPYMAAVNSGDMEEAQRLVNEAAERAGYNTKAYHGTGANFTVFDSERSGKNYRGYSKYGKGLYFSSSEEKADEWGKHRKVIPAFIDFKKPYHISLFTKEGPLLEEYNRIRKEQNPRLKPSEGESEGFLIEMLNGMTGDSGYSTEFLQDLGYDGIIAEHEGSTGYPAWTEYVAFEPTQIKSSDPVTYAEDGSVIPLSERFDPSNNDIRYSMSTTDADGNVLTTAQMEYFRNSQARDEQGKLQVVYHTTNRGGFTIFDPSYSDDKRSLFFASNFDVSQTYGRDANKPIEFLSNEEQQLADEFPFIAGDEIEAKQKGQRGYYSCYLNLENPLIVDAKGANWNSIPYGESGITIRNLRWNAEPEWDNTEDGDVLLIGYEINFEFESLNDNGEWETYPVYGNVFENPNPEDTEWFPQEDAAVLFESNGIPARYIDDVLMYADENPMDGSLEYETDEDEEISLSDTYKTRDLAKMAQNEDHDGVIIRNCRDIGGVSHLKGGNPISDIYIAFSSNQVKDTRNENPTENPDIRFSFTEDEINSRKDYDYASSDTYEMLEMYEDMLSDEDMLTEFVDASDEKYNMDYFMSMLEKYGKSDKRARKTGKAAHIKLDNTAEAIDAFYSSLTPETRMVYDDEMLEEGRKRMATSKQDFWNHLNAKWNDRWVSGGEVLKVESVKKDVMNLVMGIMDQTTSGKQYKSELVKKTLIDMRLAYQFMKQDRTDAASALLYHSALRMIENVDFIEDDTEYQNYKGLRDYLRNTRIHFSEEYWNDVDFQAYRKRNMSRVKIVKGSNDIDKGVYRELVRRWPEYFGDEALEKEGNKKNIPGLMSQLDYVLNLQVDPVTYAYSSEECAEWAFTIADDLYTIMENGVAVNSLADQYEAKNNANIAAEREKADLRVAKEKAKAEKDIAAEKARTEKAVLTAKGYKEKFDEQARAMKVRHAEAILRIRKAKEEGVAAEKAKFKEYREEQKEKKYHTKYFDSIADSHKKLTERLTTNTKDKHIPEQYKKQLAKLLAAFDLQTVGSKKLEIMKGLYYRQNYKSQKTIKMQAIKNALINIEANSSLFEINDSITDIIDRLLGKNEKGEYKEELSIEGKTIDALSASELKDIDNMLKALIHEFNYYESVRVGIKRQQASDIGSEQIKICLNHVDEQGDGKDWQNFIGHMDNILNLDEVTPAYMFRMIDRENRGLGLMFKELRRSFNRYVENQNQLNEWMEEILGEYHNTGKAWNKYGSDQIEEWRLARSAREFKLESGRTISLTPAQMMSIYCLSNREQALGHMTGAGIVVQPVTFMARMETDLKRKTNPAIPAQLTPTDIDNIKSQLTPDQVKVATKLQELMATKMAEWGNEASMNVLGIRLFEDRDYFPIKSDKAALEKDFSPQQFIESVRNFGFTKAVQPKASNSIAVNDIFDVVAEHCNQMNLYNAYSEAMNDFMKVYNYHERQDTDTGYTDYSVEQAIAYAFSKKATTYIGTFMKDLNGNVSRDRMTGIESMMNDMLGKAKKTSVFANGRVALQQPTAIMRAFAVIDPKYIKGISVTNATMNEMFEHSPIALWKSWGYYDINMGKSIEDLMMNNGKWLEDRMTDLYGKLDNRTWAAIWGMCKAEVEDKHKDVKPGTDDYWELVSDRFDEVVDLTQVVDSPFHRSHAMRSKNTLIKMATAFMSEPTLTFNMVRDGFIRAREQRKLGNKAESRRITGRTLAVFVISAGTTAAAAAIWDMVRGKDADSWLEKLLGGDDDDDDTRFGRWWDNFLANLEDNLNLLNNIYYVKDVVSIFQGWDQRNLGLQGFKHLADGYRQLTGQKVYSSMSWWQNIASGVGYLSGYPVKTVMNDINKMWDGIFGLIGITAPKPFADQLEMLDSIGGSTKDMNRGESSTLVPAGGSSSSSPQTSATNLWTYDNAPFRITDGSLADNFLNHFGINLTATEIDAAMRKEHEKRMESKKEDIKEKYADLSGEEKDKKVWSAVTTFMKSELGDKSLNDVVQEGDYNTLVEYRSMYVSAGGRLDYFNERVFDASKKAMKKSIIYNPTQKQNEAQDRIINYLLSNGMTEQELSEIAYKSDTARELKIAFRLNDKDAMLEELTPLIYAGLTYEDLERLWKNRNRVNLKTYDGKYKDRLKSTGRYNWPINGQITSGFGHRSSPGGIGSTNHQGLDIAGSMGDPVAAADGGVVVMADWYGGAGKTVQIQHDDGTITQYSHLSWWDCNVGDTVAQGQIIGNVGSTGNSTGPHLHFGVKVNGSYVDPLEYLN